jgi:type IV secretion system protein VirB10
MTVPGIKQHGEPPPGVMPRNAQLIIIAVIALLVVIATFWTGGKPPKRDDRNPPGAATGASPAQLQSFQQMLERQRREAAEETEKRLAQLREAQMAQQAPPQALSSPAVQTAPDPVEQERRKRAALAPFASNYVLRNAPEMPAEKTVVDSATQIILAPEAKLSDAKQPAVSKPEAPPAPKESGRRLPPQEGNLFRLYEGALVRATLANRLEGAFTGPVNCVVSADVLSQDEAEILIPRGSRFIGKANRVESGNQTRLAVTFSRLLMPNGYSVSLEAAPGLDTAGETGLKGKVNNHNLRKFGMAGAVGLLGGLALLGGQANPYGAGVANSTGSSATSILNHSLNALPTITVPEGHPVNIYLPEDLLLPAYRLLVQKELPGKDHP